MIGWFRGRMEFGPRALGSRSILADATNPEMKAIINQQDQIPGIFPAVRTGGSARGRSPLTSTCRPGRRCPSC